MVFLFGLIVFMEATEKEPLDWTPTYGYDDKIPLGAYILYNNLDEDTEGDRLQRIEEPPYIFLEDSTETTDGSYFFINQYVVFDDAESRRILKWVERGNTLFVVGRGIGSTILDTLNLETDVLYNLSDLAKEPRFSLSNPSVKTPKPYTIDLDVDALYFDKIDTLNTKILGQFEFIDTDSETEEDPKVHFIQQDFGKGSIVIHLMPEVFSNFALLSDTNYQYTRDALRYMGVSGGIFWDSHYNRSTDKVPGMLALFLGNRYLKWFYYILLIGVICWVIFEGKRKQRAIPIVKPLSNRSLEYTETIAGMYLDRLDHKSIAFHQINHFFEYLRTEHLVNTSKRDKTFIKKVSDKSGNTLETTTKLIEEIESLLRKSAISQEELLGLNKRIEAFKITKYGS